MRAQPLLKLRSYNECDQGRAVVVANRLGIA
jgi:hypothetical protein